MPAVQICLVILILIIVAMTKEVLRRIYVEPGFPPRPQDEIGAHRPSPEEHAGVEAPVSQSERFGLGLCLELDSMASVSRYKNILALGKDDMARAVAGRRPHTGWRGVVVVSSVSNMRK